MPEILKDSKTNEEDDTRELYGSFSSLGLANFMAGLLPKKCGAIVKEYKFKEFGVYVRRNIK